MHCRSLLQTASKGKAAYLLKGSSKKKRSRLEMEEVKHEEDQLNADKHLFLKQHKKLKQEHELLHQQLQGHKKNEETLNRLHAQGVIDEIGNPVGTKKHEPMKD